MATNAVYKVIDSELGFVTLFFYQFYIKNQIIANLINNFSITDNSYL